MGKWNCQNINWNNWNWNKRQLLIHLKSRKSMRYVISKQTAPVMQPLGKGSKCIKMITI